jgi:hypothetical protein
VGDVSGHDFSLKGDTVEEAQELAASILLPKLLEMKFASWRDADREIIMKRIQQV